MRTLAPRSITDRRIEPYALFEPTARHALSWGGCGVGDGEAGEIGGWFSYLSVHVLERHVCPSTRGVYELYDQWLSHWFYVA